jgi:intracellular septation protein
MIQRKFRIDRSRFRDRFAGSTFNSFPRAGDNDTYPRHGLFGSVDLNLRPRSSPKIGLRALIDTPLAPAAKPKALNPGLKLVLELGPLALFFLSYSRFGIFAATGVMMVTVLITLGVSYRMLGRVPIMPMVTAVIVVIFGSLTLFYHDETLIKIKPTALYILFSAALFFGIAFNKPMLQIMFDGAFHLTAEGWRKLTWRWAIFFAVLAILNEIVWRNTSTNVWVDFKVFGVMPLTLAFGALQVPLLTKYAAKPAK